MTLLHCLVSWHGLMVALLIYIARKEQQLERLEGGRPATPWWYEIVDAINRIRPGTL